jgi:tetratricopeptide (TPR) repeat protein
MTARAPISLERELADVRNLTLIHDPDAVARCATLQEHLDRLSARVELIAALAAANSDADQARATIERAIEAALALPSRDSETMLDLALAMLIADRPNEAVDVVSEGLRTGSAEDITPALLMAFVDRLRERRGSSADALLRVIYERLIAPADAPAPSPVGKLARRPPARRRRFLEETLRLIDRRLVDRPTDPTLLTVRAGVLVGLGRLEDAARSVKQALTARPDDSLARSLLVATLARKREYREAVVELEQLPPRPGAVARRVDLLVQAGTPERAVDVAEHADTGVRDDLDVRVAHAKALAAASRVPEAEQQVRQLIEEHPDREDLLLVHAEVLEAAGQRDDALSTLEQAVGRSSAEPAAHASLGRLLDEAGDPERALQELEVAHELDPGRADVLARRARLLLQLDRAVEALEVIESADAESPETASLRGEILFQLDRPDEALPWLTEAFMREHDPDAKEHLEARLEALAQKLFDAGSFKSALDTLEQLREGGEKLSRDSLALRAELLRLSARPRAAVEQAGQVLEAGFEDVWLAGTMADALISLGQGCKALPIIEEALDRTDGYSFGRSVQVAALEAVERATDALATLDRYFPPDDPPEGWKDWGTNARAEILLSLGCAFEARSVLEEAALDRPEEAQVHALLGRVENRRRAPTAAAAAFEEAADLVGGELPSWAMIEYADTLALCGRAGDAMRLYGRAIDEAPKLGGGEAPTPRIRLDNAWSRLRLGNAEAAIEECRRALDEGRDPMLVERLQLVTTLAVAGRGEQADTELAGAVAEIERLPDRERAAAIVNEGRYRLDLLGADPVWADAGERIARVREGLTGGE